MENSDPLNISPTLRSKMIIEEMKLNGKNVYNFGLGENPVKQPTFYINKLREYADKKQYTSCEGITSLNQTLKNIYNTEQTKYTILVGNGLKELLFIVQAAFNGKIIHITPSWVSYKEQIDILNKQDGLIEIQTDVRNNFHIDHIELDNVLSEIGNQPKMILFNNPNNPTGVCYDNDELLALSLIFKKHNCFVFSDEIYLNVCFQPGMKSISEYIPELTIRGSSVSKDLGCGGYRLGWVAFPETLGNIFEKCKNFSSRIYSCPCVPMQYATNDMLQNTELYKTHYTNLSELFDFISNRLTPLLNPTKLQVSVPNAAWYIFVDFSNYSKPLSEMGIDTSIKLGDHLLSELGIVTVAGQYFSHDTLSLRFAFVDFEFDFEQDDIQNVDIHQMIDGFKTLVKFLNEL